VVTAPYGETFDLAQVKAALKPEHKAVYMQATETSTAVRHDVEAIAKLVKGTETLLWLTASPAWARRTSTWMAGASTC
jgi:aspartate aminotransferase-like enzyme